MAFDYAGNQVCADSNIGIYSLPTSENVHTTPACGEFAVVQIPSAVEDTSVAATVVSELYYDIRGIE